MRKLTLIACIVLLALASCARLRPAPTPTPTPTPTRAPPTETAVPPAATPLPPTATAVPPTPTPLPTEAAFPRRSYPAVIRADFEPRPQDWIGKIPFLKELGINTIIIHIYTSIRNINLSGVLQSSAFSIIHINSSIRNT